MDALIVFLMIALAIVALDLAAVAFGADSREGFTEPRLFRQNWR